MEIARKINYDNHMIKEPYRFFFPLGTLFLLWGTLIWLPQMFTASTYPVLAHRYLMLNGFSASFIGGFLMTAVPKFSETQPANKIEVALYFLITVAGLVFAVNDAEAAMFMCSGLQAVHLFIFLLRRIYKRKVNPPYSFIFLFVGMVLWLFSALMSALTLEDTFKYLHYEGTIAALIIGVGSRLIPGILGHVEIVQSQRKRYETTAAYLKTVPVSFYVLMISFIVSFFVEQLFGNVIRTVVVSLIAVLYWNLLKKPKDKSTLTWSIWANCWVIVLSFFIRTFWADGAIHAAHSFFFSGTLMLTLLISIRVLQSHGPGDKNIENEKAIYLITALILFAGATRVVAILMPAGYFRHLGYSSLVLTLAVLMWCWRYLRYVFIFK